MLQVQPIENQLEVYRVQYVASEESQLLTLKQEVLTVLKKTANSSGFRRGKVPNNILELKFKKEIESHLKNKLVQDAYHQILFETKLKPVSAQLERAELHGNKFWCDYLIFNTPTVELKQYKDLEIYESDNSETIETRVEKLLGDLRIKFSSFEEYTEEDFVQDGDQLIIDWEIINSNNSNNRVNNYSYVVGQNDSSLPKEIASLLSGMSLKDEITKDLSDGTKLWCCLKQGKKKIPAELNDNLATKAGVEDFSNLLEILKILASKQLGEEKQQKFANSLIEKLLEINPIAVPEWFTKIELQKISKDMNMNLWQTANAQARIKLLFEAIRDKEPELVFSSQELINVFINHLSDSGKSKEESKQILQNLEKQKILSTVLLDLQEKLTLNWLISKNQIQKIATGSTEKVSFGA